MSEQWLYDLQHAPDSPIYDNIDPEELEDLEITEAENKYDADKYEQ